MKNCQEKYTKIQDVCWDLLISTFQNFIVIVECLSPLYNKNTYKIGYFC